MATLTERSYDLLILYIYILSDFTSFCKDNLLENIILNIDRIRN
jgi:hypothetical protein